MLLCGWLLIRWFNVNWWNESVAQDAHLTCASDPNRPGTPDSLPNSAAAAWLTDSFILRLILQFGRCSLCASVRPSLLRAATRAANTALPFVGAKRWVHGAAAAPLNVNNYILLQRNGPSFTAQNKWVCIISPTIGAWECAQKEINNTVFFHIAGLLCDCLLLLLLFYHSFFCVYFLCLLLDHFICICVLFVCV